MRDTCSVPAGNGWVTSVDAPLLRPASQPGGRASCRCLIKELADLSLCRWWSLGEASRRRKSLGFAAVSSGICLVSLIASCLRQVSGAWSLGGCRFRGALMPCFRSMAFILGWWQGCPVRCAWGSLDDLLPCPSACICCPRRLDKAKNHRNDWVLICCVPVCDAGTQVCSYAGGLGSVWPVQTGGLSIGVGSSPSSVFRFSDAMVSVLSGAFPVGRR